MRRKGPFQRHYLSKIVSALQRLFAEEDRSEHVPLVTLETKYYDASALQDPTDEELHSCM